MNQILKKTVAVGILLSLTLTLTSCGWDPTADKYYSSHSGSAAQSSDTNSTGQ